MPDWISADADAFLMPPPKGEIAGFPRYGDILVIKKNPNALWAPVTMEGAINLIVASRTAELDEKRGAVERVKASLADWQDPAKRAARLEGYKVAAASQPDRAKFLSGMEQAEKEAAASLQQELAPQGGVMKEYLETERALADAAA